GSAFYLDNTSGSQITTNNQPITLITDSVNIGTAAATSLSAGTSTLSIHPKTNGTAINLGGVDFPALGLEDFELDSMTAGTLRIGDANSGAITVTSTISRPGGILSLQSGGAVTENSGAAITVSNNSLAVRAGGAITLNQSNQINTLAAYSAGGSITYVEG